MPQLPGKLPDVIVNRIGDLVRDRLGLKACLTAMRLAIWGPKAVAVVSSAIAIFSHNGYLAYACCWIWMVSISVECLWRGRERKSEVLDRSVRELWALISSVPDLYQQQCLLQPPEAAAAVVLNYILERRKRVGQFGINDVGLSSWNPEY